MMPLPLAVTKRMASNRPENSVGRAIVLASEGDGEGGGVDRIVVQDDQIALTGRPRPADAIRPLSAERPTQAGTVATVDGDRTGTRDRAAKTIAGRWRHSHSL